MDAGSMRRRTVAAEGQLTGVAHKTEACDVSSGMYLELGAANDFAGDLVEGGHRRDGGFEPRRLRFALLERRGDDAGADSLGKDERVAGAGGRVFEDTVRVDEPCDGIPEFDLRITDRCARRVWCSLPAP